MPSVNALQSEHLRSQLLEAIQDTLSGFEAAYPARYKDLLLDNMNRDTSLLLAAAIFLFVAYGISSLTVYLVEALLLVGNTALNVAVRVWSARMKVFPSYDHCLRCPTRLCSNMVDCFRAAVAPRASRFVAASNRQVFQAGRYGFARHS